MAQVAMQTEPEVKANLAVILAHRPKSKPGWEEYLPEFGEVGGEFKIETAGDGD